MPNYWFLNFLKSLSFKLSHLHRHRILELKWLWNYWKCLWRWVGVVDTHIYVQRVHKSKKVLFILYFQGAILKMQIFIEYWKKILKILHFEVLNASFHCEICSIFRKLFKELHDPFAAVFIFHDCTINKCFL